MNGIYALIKLLPVQKKITMISRQSNEPSVEFQMVKKEIEAQDAGVKTVILCRTLDGGVNSSLSGKIKYFFHMFTQMYHIATSQVVLLDSYCIVVSILRHKKTLTVVQMWHSMGTMKKFGYTTLDTAEGSRHELAYAMKMHRNYDYVFASADAYKEHLASGFNCDTNKIITMPLPRLDLLSSKEYEADIRSRIYDKYPELQEKPVIVYCPTFRKDESEFVGALKDLEEHVDYNKYHLVVKLHPLSKTKPEGSVILAEEFSSFDMLFVADYVISDYSCIVYEAAVRGIPLFFYNFDMKLYEDGRGLAVDYYRELPGVISGNVSAIMKGIGEDYDMERLKQFADKYVRPTEHATEDIVQFLLRFMR